MSKEIEVICRDGCLFERKLFEKCYACEGTGHAFESMDGDITFDRISGAQDLIDCPACDGSGVLD